MDPGFEAAATCLGCLGPAAAITTEIASLLSTIILEHCNCPVGTNEPLVAFVLSQYWISDFDRILEKVLSSSIEATTELLVCVGGVLCWCLSLQHNNTVFTL